MIRSPTFKPVSTPTGTPSSKRTATTPIANDGKKNKEEAEGNPLAGKSLEEKIDFLILKFLKWDPIIVDLEQNHLDPALVNKKFFEVDNELERINRDQIVKNIVITGLDEANKESPAELCKKVEEFLGKLNIPDLDYSYCRRIPTKSSKRPRLVQVKLLRQKDKYAIFAEAMAARSKDFMKGIFINAELTKFERIRNGKLRETRRNLKKANQDTKMQIRNGTMKVTTNGQVKWYGINEDGVVAEIDTEADT